MICFLCGFKSNVLDDLKKHYVNYHKINANNFFFLKLFTKQNSLICKECARCNKFLTTDLSMTKHNFLKHHNDGERKPAEYKPIDIIKRGEITLYQITYDKHSDEYNFFDSEEIVEDFLFNIENLYKPLSNVMFKADFAIVNIQAAPIVSNDISDIKNIRSWSTEVYKSTYLNDFVISGIRKDILKGVINNNLTGSSWHFNRFHYLNFKVVEIDKKINV